MSRPGWVLATVWRSWLARALMTPAAIDGSPTLLTLSSALSFPLLLVWSGWMAANPERRPG